ncbi:MAG: ABC transporter permease, partial [Alphaproteobacteria bacterium]
MTDNVINPRGGAMVRPAPPPRKWTSARITGHVLVGVWAALILGLLFYLYGAWNIELVRKYAPTYLA